MKYRKKPVEVEAFKWSGPNTRIPKEFKAMDAGIVTPAYLDLPGLEIKTLEGYITAAHGDFIIKGVKGEYYPCKPDIFALTYESAPPPPSSAKAEPCDIAWECAEHKTFGPSYLKCAACLMGPVAEAAPGGLSEKEQYTARILLEILDEREWIPDTERANGGEGARQFNSDYAALVRRLLTPAPNREAELKVIEAANELTLHAKDVGDGHVLVLWSFFDKLKSRLSEIK